MNEHIEGPENCEQSSFLSVCIVLDEDMWVRRDGDMFGNFLSCEITPCIGGRLLHARYEIASSRLERLIKSLCSSERLHEIKR